MHRRSSWLRIYITGCRAKTDRWLSRGLRQRALGQIRSWRGSRTARRSGRNDGHDAPDDAHDGRRARDEHGAVTTLERGRTRREPALGGGDVRLPRTAPYDGTVRPNRTVKPTGQPLCLSFTNTVNKRPDPDRDDLTSLSATRAWAMAAGIADEARLASLADYDLSSLAQFRESLFVCFSALARDQQADEAVVSAVLQAFGRASGTATLVRTSEGIDLCPAPNTGGARLVHDAVALSAGRVLMTPADLRRLKECPGCRWLFIDSTRAGNRRWCSMDTCGSRDKMRRYYRKKAAGREDVRFTG
jgi:predicted RNA-binding Zn ribbon-like protein